MVSTRGPRYKFSEGERVLCYEPDPTKAKVLYDSKVLEVMERKDKRGRRSMEYLIHFQGWNSSWDRCVREELVLKDTEHNRQLQRTLADNAQLQIGAYLYRRDRKKGVSTGPGPGPGKRPRIQCDGDSSTASSPEDGDVDGIPQPSSSESSSSSCQDSDCEYHSVTIPLGPGLRQRLTLDYELVVCGGQLVRLPCRPSALQLLEDCVLHHTTQTLSLSNATTTNNTANATANNAQPPQQTDVQDQIRRLNILREVADGLRIYLDFILRDQLLYEGERQQYMQAVADGMLKDTLPPPSVVKQEEESGGSIQCPEDYSHLTPFLNSSHNIRIKREVISPCEDLPCKSSPSPDWQDLRIKSEDNTSDTSKETNKEDDSQKSGENSIWDNNCHSLPGMSMQTRSREVTSQEASRTSRESPNHFHRHSSEVSEAASDSQLEPKENDGEISEAGSALSSQEDSRSDSQALDEDSRLCQPGWKECLEENRIREGERDPTERITQPNNVKSRTSKIALRRPRSRTLDDRPSTTSRSSSVCTAAGTGAESNGCSGSVAEEFKHALDWRIVPPDHPPYPAAVYGAIHLARLFVKLPEYLSLVNMPESKLELIIEHVEYFVQYLEEHKEWFGESFYYTPSASTPS